MIQIAKHRFRLCMSCLLLSLLLSLSVYTVFADASFGYSFQFADHFTVMVDGEIVDIRPILVQERTLLPVRSMAELIGCRVDWLEEQQMVVVYAPSVGEPLLEMELFNQEVVVHMYNGDSGETETTTQTIDVPPVLAESRTYVPLRFIAETLGYEVEFADSVVHLISVLYDGPRPSLEETDGPPPRPGFIDAGAYVNMMLQEYEGKNIAEIPMISYDGAALAETGFKNPEIEMINLTIKSGILQEYYEFMDLDADMEWIEIKTYPFSTETGIDIVMSKAIYPSYADPGEIWSYNYDKEKDIFVTLDDQLAERGLNAEDLMSYIADQFPLSRDGGAIDRIELTGYCHLNGEMVVLVQVYEAGSDDDILHKQLLTYNVDSGSLNEMYDGSRCLFDPAALDVMDPPLSYAR